MHNYRFRNRAFTLIELLVVIAIIAVLIGLLLPAVQKVRESAARSQCQNNLKQIGLACQSYASANLIFPQATSKSVDVGNTYGPWASWMYLILPYLEQNAIYNGVVSDFPNLDAANWPNLTPPVACNKPVKIYYCPSDPRGLKVGGGIANYFFGSYDPTQPSNYSAAFTDYVGVAGVDMGSGGPKKGGILNSATIAYNYAPLPVPSVVRVEDVTDGASNTLLVGERPFINDLVIPTSWAGGYSLPLGIYLYGGDDTIAGIQNNGPVIFFQYNGSLCPMTSITDPAWKATYGAADYTFGAGPNDLNNPCSFNYVWSCHPGGLNFAFADGSVHFISKTISQATISALATYAFGDIPGAY